MNLQFVDSDWLITREKNWTKIASYSSASLQKVGETNELIFIICIHMTRTRPFIPIINVISSAISECVSLPHLNLCLTIEKWNIPCYISEQGCHSYQWLEPPGMMISWALTELRKGENPSISQPSDCSHYLWWDPRKLRMWKPRILAPDSWGAYQRNDFSEPRFLHLSITRKNAKFFNLGNLVFFR